MMNHLYPLLHGNHGVIIFLAIIAWLVRRFYNHVAGPESTATIPGPPSKSFLFGHLRELMQGEVGEYQFKWKKQYGGVIKYKGILGENCLLISDPKALHHISSRPDEFTKHPILKEFARMVFGKGLIWADGDDHRRQRSINSAGFGKNQVRALLPCFQDCAAQVTEKWNAIIRSSKNGTPTIDVTRMISLCALDAVGKGAFDYDFQAITDSENELSTNELANCFRNYAHDLYGTLDQATILAQEVIGWLPVKVASLLYDYAPVKELKRVRYVTGVGFQAAQNLIDTKSNEMNDGKSKKDVLSLLVRANAAPSDSRLKLSHDELSATLHTIIIAGHETTATWMNWIMYELARNPQVQHRLRQEINERVYAAINRGDATLTAEDYENEMPYLQAVLKETLRFHAAVYHHLKISTVDSMVPLTHPVITTDGKVLESLNIEKGTHLYLDLAGFNRDPEIFGEDADVWRPERFLNGEVNETAGIAGPYASVMSFSAGPRTCIGWRFAVMEAAVFTTEFTRSFEFSLSPKSMNIKRAANMAMIPVIKGEEEKGHQLPLVMSSVTFDE